MAKKAISTGTSTLAKSSVATPRSFREEATGGTRWCSLPASASTRPRSGAASAKMPLGSASSAITPRTRAAVRASLDPPSRASACVIPTDEDLMIARHTGALLDRPASLSAEEIVP